MLLLQLLVLPLKLPGSGPLLLLFLMHKLLQTLHQHVRTWSPGDISSCTRPLVSTPCFMGKPCRTQQQQQCRTAADTQMMSDGHA
jgi:hypothetical protein